jgi:hypothetical protein
MKDALKFLSFPVGAVGTTLFWIWLDVAMGWHGLRWPWVGRVLVLLGTLLVLWCSVLFLRIGKGSPHPVVAKTQRLVTSVALPKKVTHEPLSTDTPESEGNTDVSWHLRRSRKFSACVTYLRNTTLAVLTRLCATR